MQDYILYSPNEMIALVFSVLIGTGAYLGYLFVKRGQKFSIWVMVLIFVINFFITNLVSELLRKWNFGEYRSIALPLAAFGGQYLMEWFDKRYLKIFDAGAKKMGLDIDSTSELDEPHNNNENINNTNYNINENGKRTED